MGLVRTADGLSSADVQGMSLDPTASDPSGYQTPRDLVSEPSTDGQDPATPGGPAPYNGAEPLGKPVTTDPMWRAPDAPKPPPNTPTPYTGPGPSVDTTTLHNARRMPMEETMTADLWVTASQDADQEREKERMVRAKVAATAIWPFLSAAASEREFGHRLALCEDQLAVLFPEEGFRTRVAKSLHEDYLVLTGTKIEDLWEDFGKTASAPDPVTAVAQGYDWSHHEATVEDAEGTPRPEQNQSLANPDFFSQGPEAGPVTGDSAHYPVQQAPDPFNPVNAEFPLTPTQWVVPPDAAWVDRPMQFGHQAAQQPLPRAHEASAGYVDEGVQTGLGQNPNYFAAPEGVSAGQNAFPPDPSPPEEDERVNMLGDVPPGSPSPAPEVPYSNAGKQASRWVVAEKDNHGACSHCNTPVYRQGDTWKHLGGDPGHGVRLHEEHPWLVAEQNRRTLASKQTVTANTDPGRRVTAQWVTAEVSSSDMGSGGGDAGQSQVDPTSAPPAPQSMQPGGAGSMAGPPLTIPNDQASTNPFATSGGGPAPVEPSMGGMTNSFTAMRYVAETMNRPTVDNPTGVDTADEFDVNNWEAPAQQRPRQEAADRGVNTPQRPGQPIPVNSTEVAEESEEERR